MNIFEVCYDDSTFADNQNKIEEISNTIIKRNSEVGKIKNFKILEICNKVIEIELNSKIKKNKFKENNEIIEEEDDGNNSVDYKDSEEENNEKNDLENNMLDNMEMNMINLDNNEDNKDDNKDNNSENKDENK